MLSPNHSNIVRQVFDDLKSPDKAEIQNTKKAVIEIARLTRI